MLEKNKDIFEFFRYMIGFRKEHDIVRKDTGHCSLGFPEIQVMEADDYCKILRIIYAGRNDNNTRDDIVCLAVNVFWEEQEFCLPPVTCGMGWYVGTSIYRIRFRKKGKKCLFWKKGEYVWPRVRFV